MYIVKLLKIKDECDMDVVSSLEILDLDPYHRFNAINMEYYYIVFYLHLAVEIGSEFALHLCSCTNNKVHIIHSQ